ncbi:hypothetical protein ASPNIDRAFT_38111 [Aspergillus niger ATCC 1015]|uniref:Uncharacterized protein n=1 Tax=Aspergillus niger (strain ATCC 1015 / CBS 113.46 / FGSC A1144 / LSHB Ac4 / NCTC 3858a / NRRL 328 / USDA 3528.7) TaxID=380704 RepID=G3YEU9_ASPNA|nr:hypothetical protein ASPNIDRAFT_38111 [Aspergillus niger ATCC 1015]
MQSPDRLELLFGLKPSLPRFEDRARLKCSSRPKARYRLEGLGHPHFDCLKHTCNLALTDSQGWSQYHIATRARKPPYGSFQRAGDMWPIREDYISTFSAI